MYLLNPVGLPTLPNITVSFTFHYVSIKSEWVERDIKEKLHLHSTMYLLNLRQAENVGNKPLLFTFHYVSIKSLNRLFIIIAIATFTFHYVSIKS